MWLDFVYHEGRTCGNEVNNKIGTYLKNSKGRRQWDALSPLLFDMAADALAIIVDKARHNGIVKGILGGILNHGVNMRQYADDTFFFAIWWI